MFFSQVFKLLTDLKEQRKDSGKNKHSAGQQNLNTIMYEVCVCCLPLFTGFNLSMCLLCYIYSEWIPHSVLCISPQTLKYLSKTPCSRQSPEIVKEFLTTMMPHKLTKSVRSGRSIGVFIHMFFACYTEDLHFIFRLTQILYVCSILYTHTLTHIH